MFLNPKVDPLLLVLLGIGGIVVLGNLLNSSREDTMNFPYDAVLRERMKAVDLTSWQTLQTQAELSRTNLRQLRNGEIDRLTLKQISQIATVLDLPTAELLLRLGSTWVEASAKEPATETNALLDWQQQVEQLRDRLQQQESALTADLRELTFQQLQTLLTNFPSARKMAEVKPEMPAKNLTALFAPLEGMLSSWGYEAIGQVWESVGYNPEIHQADSDDIETGESVFVRFVGYRAGDRILCPAKVSRTLPGGVQ